MDHNKDYKVQLRSTVMFFFGRCNTWKEAGMPQKQANEIANFN